MLPQKYRLKSKEIERVFKKGRIYRGVFLLLKLKRNNLKVSRFAFVVPMSLSKKAPKRNRLRRQLQEILRKKLSFLKIGFDGILIALPGALEKNYKEIEKEIDKLLRLADISE